MKTSAEKNISNYIEKISFLFNQIRNSGNDSSQLEIDLLKKYVIELYEAIGSVQSPGIKADSGLKEKVEAVRPKPKATRPRPQSKPKKKKPPVSLETEVLDTSKLAALKTTKKTEKVVEEVAELHSKLSAGNASRELGEQLKKRIDFEISYNDRYAFIQHLFDGNVNVYEGTLKELGKAENVIEAYSYLNLHVKPTYDWKDDDELTQSFLAIIKNKFYAE